MLNPTLLQFQKYLEGKMGLLSSVFNTVQWEKRIKKRMEAIQIPSPTDYYNYLVETRKEQQALIELFVVGETSFFRDEKIFPHLQKHLQKRWTQKGPPIEFRLLSIPSATGEEAISILISLLEVGIPLSSLYIDGIDISALAVNKAKEAFYDDKLLANFSQLKKRYFLEAEGGWKLQDIYLEHLNYRVGNILFPDFLVGKPFYDVIFFRNLLIYLTYDQGIKALEVIHHLLKPGGLLFLGSAEMERAAELGYQPLPTPSSFCYVKGEEGLVGHEKNRSFK